MKATVDQALCIGCGLCAATCPKVFEMDGSVSKVIVDTVPADAVDSCREAADSCPVSAIKITE